MKLIVLIVTTILLIGCSNSQQKSQKIISPEDKLYLVMDIQKDPKEKKPIFYEIPGRWKAKGTDQDCEQSWTQLTISEDKKTLTISPQTQGKANAPIDSSNLPFKIEKASRTTLSLTELSAAAEAWEITMPTFILYANAKKITLPMLTVFSLTPKNDPGFSMRYLRCIKNMQITIGKPVIIEGDLSEALKKVDQK